MRVHGDTIKDGMLTSVWIAAASVHDATLLPEVALVYSEDSPFVFTLMPDGSRVEKRQVEVELSNHTRVAIRSGVKDGELVITAGQHLLDDGMAVQVAAAHLSTTGNPTATGSVARDGNQPAPARQR